VVSSFGERLKKEREKRGLTLEDVSGATKISVRNLRALELEKFDTMPGGIFNRGFVRAYAKHLGLDDDQVVADYREAAGETVPTPEAPTVPVLSNVREKAPVVEKPPIVPPVRPQTPSAQVPWAAVIGLIILGTVLLALWSYHSRRRADESGSGSEPASTHIAEASGLPHDAARTQAETSTTPDTPGAGFDLALRAHDEVWLSTAVDGKPPSEAIMEDGQSITVHALERAILKVGNAGALDVAFNGKIVPVRAADGEVRTLTFTPSGLQAPVPPAQKPN
jgi:transcriptional regulator with XRE-family HTH domain